MASSLDRLKALSSKLEEKLEEKGKKAEKVSVDTPKKEMPKVQKTIKKEQTPKSVTPQKKEQSVQKNKKATIAGTESVRKENINRVKELYNKLKIFEKAPDFDNIFIYKAMNLSGIGLKEEDFGEVREGKYIQIIAITYEPDKNGKKKAKNISLGYFGKAKTLESRLKNEIIEFVLRWRYEKAFQNLEHYKDLIARVEVPKDRLF